MDVALELLHTAPPDVFNHNLETVPRLYRKARPGSDYAWSLKLLQRFKQVHPDMPTKSGLMLGLGETLEEVQQVMADLRAHECDMLTLGQYLQPSLHHLPVTRYVTPEEFDRLARGRPGNGLHPCGQRPDGAFVLSRRSAGVRSIGFPLNRHCGADADT